MVDIRLKLDFEDIIDELDDLVKKQIPYAAFLALKETAYKASVAVKADLPYYIEGGPVGFTARGVRYINPKSKRNLQAKIYIPDDQWKYMRWVVQGGTKRWNRSEFGIGKPIYKNTRFNKYGNIPGRKRKEGLWREALRRGQGDNLFPLKGAKLPAKQFVGKLKSGDNAVFRRIGKTGVKLLMVFKDEAEYGRGSFPFNKVTVMHVHKMFGPFFNAHLENIVRRESEKLRIK